MHMQAADLDLAAARADRAACHWIGGHECSCVPPNTMLVPVINPANPSDLGELCSDMARPVDPAPGGGARHHPPRLSTPRSEPNAAGPET